MPIVNNFKTDKETYKNNRNKEKEKIGKGLSRNRYSLLHTNANSEHGKTNYTCGGTIKAYDNSNWLWIVAEKTFSGRKVEVYIYLQTPVFDPNTVNHLALFDRICYSFGIDGKKVTADDLIFTDYDLPLEEKEIDDLINDIDREISKHI